MTRLSLLLASALLSLNASALELAKYPQVFDAGQGVSVQLAPSADGKQALSQAADAMGRNTLPRVNRAADDFSRASRSRDRTCQGELT